MGKTGRSEQCKVAVESGSLRSVRDRERTSAFKFAAEWRAQTSSAITEKRLRFSTAAALFAALILSPRLWICDRSYPLTPVTHLIGSIPNPFDESLYVALLAVLTVIALVSRPFKWIVAAVSIGAVLALYDQSRWQPWFYQYLVMLIALALYHRRSSEHHDDHDAAWNTCRLLMVCTYFWSGWQKVHAEFVTRSFPWLLEPLTGWLPHAVSSKLNWFGVVAPFIEIGMGLGLLSRRFRQIAIYVAFGMHAFILLTIGPLGRDYNMVVWPWNIAMCVFLWILFGNRPSITAREILWPARMGFHRLVLVLFAFMPMLSFFGMWDGDLSLALYSEVRNNPTLYVSHALALRLPPEIKSFVYSTKSADVHTINIFEWSLSDVNACSFPEPRIYKNIAAHLCSYAQQPNDLRLVIERKRILFSPNRQTSYTCDQLGK